MNILYILYGLLALILVITIGFLYSYIFYKGEVRFFLEKAIGEECLPELAGQCGANAVCTPDETKTRGVCTEREKSEKQL
jgi:hypothetical protein